MEQPWAATELDEGQFFAVGNGEQIGPFATRDEAQEAADAENEEGGHTPLYRRVVSRSMIQ